jgi:hypothetical protein
VDLLARVAGGDFEFGGSLQPHLGGQSLDFARRHHPTETDALNAGIDALQVQVIGKGGEAAAVDLAFQGVQHRLAGTQHGDVGLHAVGDACVRLVDSVVEPFAVLGFDDGAHLQRRGRGDHQPQNQHDRRQGARQPQPATERTGADACQQSPHPKG